MRLRAFSNLRLVKAGFMIVVLNFMGLGQGQ
jgi:hypothetical protein